jgi:hypothetical protein
VGRWAIGTDVEHRYAVEIMVGSADKPLVRDVINPSAFFLTVMQADGI